MLSTEFQSVFEGHIFDLPKRVEENDFYATFTMLLKNYKNKIGAIDIENEEKVKIKKICDGLLRCTKYYLQGFPAKAYHSFEYTMKTVISSQSLKVYQKSNSELIEGSYQDPLHLFRVTCPPRNEDVGKEWLFHIPYNKRSKVKAYRYSISGYPCLYLGTDLELCCQEVNCAENEKRLAAKFQLNRNENQTGIQIEVIEMALKPQYFFGEEYKRIRINWGSEEEVKKQYLYWYPLIAGCSFIRDNKDCPFAEEYIIPQLFMQWVQTNNRKKGNHGKLTGIRYFSCSSEAASSKGINYVFPGSGKGKLYCEVLSRAFKMTKPYCVEEYNCIKECEKAMKKDNQLAPIVQ